MCQGADTTTVALACGKAPVDGIQTARDETRRVRSEKIDELGYFGGLAHTAHGVVFRFPVPKRLHLDTLEPGEVVEPDPEDP